MNTGRNTFAHSKKNEYTVLIHESKLYEIK